jgi:hypothetical protein
MSEGWFAGNHGPEGAWSSLKGKMMEPHTAAPLDGDNSGDPRFNGTAGSLGWTKSTLVTTGKTGGGGTFAK